MTEAPPLSPTLVAWDAERAAWEADNATMLADEEKEIIPDTIDVPSFPLRWDTPRVFIGTAEGPVLAEIPGGAKTVVRKALKNGWELRGISYARGPWMHSTHWTPVSTSDTVVVRLVGVVDGKPRAAVALWRDKKFDHAYLLSTEPMRMANSKELKEWVEE